MTDQLNLEIGKLYFGVSYEDEEMAYPIIQSYEYLGLDGENADLHLFRILGSGDELEVGESNLDLILSLSALNKLLVRWADKNPSLAVR